MSDLENITPAHLRCSVGGCSSIHRLADGTLLVVGKIAETHHVATAPDGVGGKLAFVEKTDLGGIVVGIGETVVIISPELLGSLKAEWVREAVAAENKRCGDIFIDALGFNRRSVEEAILLPAPGKPV